MKSKEIDFEKENKKKEGKSKKSLGITIGSIVILILSAITFILVPSMSGFSSSQEKIIAGSYKGKDIEYGYGTDYLSAVQNYAQYYQQLAQQQGVTLSQYDYYSIFQGAFNSVVLDMMYTDFVNDSGYVPSENAIKREMIKYFTDENGNYSAKAFREASETYKKSLRESIVKSDISGRYKNDNFGLSTNYIANTLYGLKASGNEGKFFDDLTKKTRSFNMVAFSKDNYPDSEVVKYANSNKELFNIYNLSAITATEEETIKNIKKQLDNNEITFDDAANTLSAKSYTDDSGKLNSKYAYQIKNILTSDEDVTKLSSLSAGSVTDILKTATGYAIFRCDGALETPDFTTDDVIADVKYYINYNEQGIVDDYFMALANDFASSAATLGFDEAAEAAGLEKKEIPSFSINYGGNSYVSSLPFSNISELSGAETNETFFKTAFSLKENEISSPITIGNNIIVIKLLEETIREPEEGEESDNLYYQYLANSFTTEGVESTLLDNPDVVNDVFNLWIQMM